MIDDAMARHIEECVEHAAEERDLSKAEKARLAHDLITDVYVNGECYYDKGKAKRVPPEDVEVIGKGRRQK